MNRFTLSLMALMVLVVGISACEDNNETSQNHVQWEKIEFAKEGVIYAIHGDLEDYLLVTTYTKILRTENGGKTWDTVQTVIDPIGGFNVINDDLYAVSNGVDYLSKDQGQTWKSVAFDHELYSNSLNFNDSKGKLYQVVNHFDGELGLPTSLLRSTNKGNSWENIFPYKHSFYSWHIDNHDRVYIGTSGSPWNGQSFTDDNPQFRAYLFYMK